MHVDTFSDIGSNTNLFRILDGGEGFRILIRFSNQNHPAYIVFVCRKMSWVA